MRAKPIGLVAAAVVVLLGIVVLAAILLTRPSRLDVLRTEASLRVMFPAATLLAEGGRTKEEAISNQVFRVYGTEAPQREVLDFHLAAWTALGYSNGGGSSMVPSQFEDFACAMHKGDHVMRLAFYEPDAAHRLLPASEAFPTVFRVALVEKVVGDFPRPCNILINPEPSQPPG